MKVYFANWKDATSCVVNCLKNNPDYYVQFEREACECGGGSVICMYDQKLVKKFIGIVCKCCYDKISAVDECMETKTKKAK